METMDALHTMDHAKRKNAAIRNMHVTYYNDDDTIVLKIGRMSEKEWPAYMAVLEEIEQFMIDNEEMRLDLQCQMMNDTSILYVMHVLKLAERYHWVGEKIIKVNCDLGLGRSYRFWLKEKLQRCFELDIRFTQMMAT